MQIDERVKLAVQNYWQMRQSQARNQQNRGVQDQGARSAVTGGKQLNGFVEIIKNTLLDCGLSQNEIFYNTALELPGYYRPEKQWDIVVVADQKLVAAMEFKSQASSFGNNFNNRVEEAVGSATDLWVAYREQAIPTIPRPWLGYLFLIIESPLSTRPVRVCEPHFPVFPEFRSASYTERYRILLERLILERLYEASCLLTTPIDTAINGDYREPDPNLSFVHFEESLRAHVMSFQRTRERN